MSATTTAPAPIVFPCELTEPLWQQWLDALPGRREAHQHDADQRAMLARLFALKGSPPAVALLAVAAAGRKLVEAIDAFLSQSNEFTVDHILRAAGLPVPDVFARCQSWGSATFDYAHDDCRWLRKKLRKFLYPDVFGVGRVERFLEPSNEFVVAAAEGGDR